MSLFSSFAFNLTDYLALNGSKLNPYAFNLAINGSCEVKSTVDLHFSSIDSEQCWALYTLSKISGIFGKIVTGP